MTSDLVCLGYPVFGAPSVRMGGKDSVPGSSPLGPVLANLLIYEHIPRAYVVLLQYCSVCVLYNLDSGERWSLNGSLSCCIIL